MLKKKILPLLILLVIFVQPFIGVRTFASTVSSTGDDVIYAIQNSKSTLQPPGAGGEEVLKANIIQNPGFEETEPNGLPSYYEYSGDAYENLNASYQDETCNGSYSCLVASKGTEQFSSNADMYKQTTGASIPYLNQIIYLDMWYFIQKNPNVDGTIYLNLYFYDGSLRRHINYYLSHDNSLSNGSSNYKYYDLNSSLGTWHNLARNITYDYEQVYGTFAPSTRLLHFDFYALSPPNPSDFTEGVIDDVYIVNSTGYNFIPGNNDFENGDGSYWSNFKRGPSSIYPTTDHTEGAQAVNLTASAYFDNSNSNVELATYIGNYDTTQFGYYATEPGRVTVEFDWKYNDVANSGINSDARIYLTASNSTYYTLLSWTLGSYNDEIRQGNYSGATYRYVYYEADGLGVRDTWQHFSLDLFDVMNSINCKNMPITSIGFAVQAGTNKNSTTELLIDGFEFRTYPTGDPFFAPKLLTHLSLLEQDLFHFQSVENLQLTRWLFLSLKFR